MVRESVLGCHVLLNATESVLLHLHFREKEDTGLQEDAYLQDLARKICVPHGPEPPRRARVSKIQGSEASGLRKKKRKKTPKKFREQEQKASEHKAKTLGEKKSPVAPGTKKPTAHKEEPSISTGAPAGGQATAPDSVFALDVLRQRLHEKIQQARGQDGTLSAASLEKRQRRKQERERKKRKRRELLAKEKEKAAAAQAGGTAAPSPNGLSVPQPRVPCTRPTQPCAAGMRAQDLDGLLGTREGPVVMTQEAEKLKPSAEQRRAGGVPGKGGCPGQRVNSTTQHKNGGWPVCVPGSHLISW
ncbi:surfeit locus protein 6 [Marmota marmota marmota]|uniref:surfeit locus protein 6 n=1 Tax=Marmota marmota marmota TaxID=9994 RepID=UPI0020928DC7|nr:surfeit locus protein 6 [Marmota marmota marmota]